MYPTQIGKDLYTYTLAMQGSAKMEEELLTCRWLSINEEIMNSKVIDFTSAIELWDVGTFVFEIIFN
jgi:hypothetical protein